MQARSSDLEELKMTLLSLNSIVGELKAEKQSLQSEMEGKVAEVRATEKEVQAQRARLEALQAEAASLASQTAVAVAAMTSAAESAAQPSADNGADEVGVRGSSMQATASAEASDCDNAASAPALSADEDAVAKAMNASLDDSLTMAVDLSADLSAAVVASGGSVDDPHVRQAFVWVAELEAEKAQLENEKDALEQEVAGLEARCQLLDQQQELVDESKIAKAVDKALEQERERHLSAAADQVSEVEALKAAVATSQKRADATVAAAEAKTVALVAAAESRAKKQIEDAQNELDSVRRQLTQQSAGNGSGTLPESKMDKSALPVPNEQSAWGTTGNPKPAPPAALKNDDRKQPGLGDKLKLLQAQLRKAREEAATERALHHVTKELLWAAKHGGFKAKLSRNGGDWLCVACDFKNFGTRGACFKCGSKRPAAERAVVKATAADEAGVDFDIDERSTNSAGGQAAVEKATQKAVAERAAAEKAAADKSAASKAAAENRMAEKAAAEKAVAEKAAAEKAAAEKAAAEKAAAEKAAAEKAAAAKAAAEKAAAEKAAAEKAATEKAATEKAAAEKAAAEKAAAEKAAAEKAAAEKAATDKAAAENAAALKASAEKTAAEHGAADKAERITTELAATELAAAETSMAESASAKPIANPEAVAVNSGGECLTTAACQNGSVQAASSMSQRSAHKVDAQNALVATDSEETRSRCGSQGADSQIKSMPPPSRPKRYRGRSRSRSRSRHQGRSRRVADFHPIGTAATAAVLAAAHRQQAAESDVKSGPALSSIVGRAQQFDISSLVPLPEWLRVEGRVMKIVVRNGTKELQLNTATFIAGCFGLVLLLELFKALRF